MPDLSQCTGYSSSFLLPQISSESSCCKKTIRALADISEKLPIKVYQSIVHFKELSRSAFMLWTIPISSFFLSCILANGKMNSFLYLGSLQNVHMFKQSLIHIPVKIYVQFFHTVFCRGFCEDLMGLAETLRGKKHPTVHSKTANFLSIKLCLLIGDSEDVLTEGIKRARKVWKNLSTSVTL